MPQQETLNVSYEFAIDLATDPKDISQKNTLAALTATLQHHPNIHSHVITPSEQSCLVSTSLPPSEIIHRIRSSTGLQTILRGISLSESHALQRPSAAAVCIFEYFPGMKPGKWAQFDNRGLCRLVQTRPNSCLVDLSMSHLEPNTHYKIDVCEFGDLSNGMTSTGTVLYPMGQFKSDTKGNAQFVNDVDMNIHQVIGRSIVVENVQSGMVREGMAGIIARSAGLFENDKKVCSCSGKTLWEESVATDTLLNVHL